MRLLGEVYDRGELARLENRLRAKGIATHATSMHPFRMPHPYRAKLFVLVDAQYDDAVALLRNPKHKVRIKVDVDAFDRAIEKPPYGWLLPRVLIVAVIVIVIAVLAAGWGSSAGASR